MVEQSHTNQKVVFILDHPEDIGEYQKTGNSIEGFHVLIATSPDVCWELESRSIPFKSIEDYWDPEEIYILGMNNYDILDRLCSSIDEILKNNNPLLKRYDLNPALDNFHYLKILHDGITFRIALIQSIIRNEKPDALVTFQFPKIKETFWNSYDMPFNSTENIYAIVMSMKGWSCITRIIIKNDAPIKNRIKESFKQTLFHKFKKEITKYPSFFIPLFSLKNLGPIRTIEMLLYQHRNYFQKSTSLFLLRQEPSWSSIIYQIYKKGYQVVYLPSRIDQENSEVNLDPEIRKTIVDHIRSFALYRDIDYSEIFSHHMILTISTYIASVPQFIGTIEDMINSYYPAAFLCSEKASIVEHIYAHIGKFHHIPVLAWQHGESPSYLPMQVYVELMNSDVHLSYGSGHQKWLRAAPHNHFDCRIDSVGSLILEKIYRKKPVIYENCRILYVTTWYYYNSMYVNCFPLHDNILWAYQKKIIKVLGESTLPVMFKLGTDPNRKSFILNYLQKNYFSTSNISVIQNEKTFLELLDDANIVICDFPSTPLIEAIAAHKTVFVLLESSHLRKEALDPLKKRVYWSDDIDEFVRLIHDYLSGLPIDQHPDINNTEYLEMFGLAKLDGDVSQRALDIIEREIHSFSK
jgi:hypothetical protein